MSYPILYSAADAFIKSDKSRNNAGLVFDRFVPHLEIDERPKKDGLNSVIQTRRDADLLKALGLRWQALTAEADRFEVATDWRFLTGVGKNTPYEVGFAFDRYGFANLLGSSVKGIARAYAFWCIAKALKLKRSKQVKAKKNAPPTVLNHLEIALEELSAADQESYGEQFRKRHSDFAATSADALRLVWQFHQIFGNTDLAGSAIFYDAIPLDDPKLVLDVMNPHYPKYYQGAAPPTNWQSPIPIYFLAVDKGVKFGFAIGWRNRDVTNQAQTELRTLAKTWLLGGLTELGAGAKTSSGYGFFIEKSLLSATKNTPEIAQIAIGGVDNSNGQAGIAVVRPDGSKMKVKLESWRKFGFDNDPAGKTRVEFEYVGELKQNCKVIRIKRV